MGEVDGMAGVSDDLHRQAELPGQAGGGLVPGRRGALADRDDHRARLPGRGGRLKAGEHGQVTCHGTRVSGCLGRSPGGSVQGVPALIATRLDRLGDLPTKAIGSRERRLLAALAAAGRRAGGRGREPAGAGHQGRGLRSEPACDCDHGPLNRSRRMLMPSVIAVLVVFPNPRTS